MPAGDPLCRFGDEGSPSSSSCAREDLEPGGQGEGLLSDSGSCSSSEHMGSSSKVSCLTHRAGGGGQDCTKPSYRCLLSEDLLCEGGSTYSYIGMIKGTKMILSVILQTNRSIHLTYTK